MLGVSGWVARLVRGVSEQSMHLPMSAPLALRAARVGAALLLVRRCCHACTPTWVVGRRSPICIGIGWMVGALGRWGVCMVDPIDWLERLGVGLYMQIVIDVLVGES